MITLAQVKAPVEGYEGVVGTARFVDGQTVTDDPILLAYFARHGYTITTLEPEPVEEKPANKPVGKKTGK
ncbi:hypothetical protein [Actinobaculum sp. 352]|uniref:hypothetical protein n=1 Tax=Actinobaculum sp. 352 TaxID=2490946 RepID=UPI000F7E4E56|nr:hypothetical protein [Actinobaculum sp. 352]RTE47896.1 hypothetical protein EKN07_11595 [Actinobaculum sp. 352]